MPDKSKINKFLTEYFGKCWHEWDDKKLKFLWKCIKCEEPIGILQYEYIHSDYFSDSGFFELIGLMKEKDIWGNFLASCVGGTPSLQTASYYFVLIDTLLNPDTFAPAVAEFLGYKEE